MNFMILLTGCYTEEEFLASIHHLDELRKKHPDVGFETVIGPNPWSTMPPGYLAKKLNEAGATVVQVPLRDFVHHTINTLSSHILSEVSK